MVETDFDLGTLALPTATAGPRRAELGQEEFLELMVAQIANQDPFEPMENGAFVGQLAQFSTVTGIGEISQSVAGLADALLANQAIQASTMVGREVLVETPTAILQADGNLSGSIEFPLDSSSARVRISDSAGQLVREFEVVGSPGGLVDYAWDGVNRNGEAAAPGIYQIQASTGNGQTALNAPTFSHVQVTSVSLDPSGKGSLITTEDGQQLRLSQVRAVR